jgi:hypothetical protein
MRRIAVLMAVAVLAIAAMAIAKPGFGTLYYDGQVVRTVVPPAAMPKAGVDDLYVIMGGVQGQLPVVAVAPGAAGYHGGQWAFHKVTWNTTPHLLTSAAAVLSARASGDVTIERVPANDFKCPVQP